MDSWETYVLATNGALARTFDRRYGSAPDARPRSSFNPAVWPELSWRGDCFFAPSIFADKILPVADLCSGSRGFVHAEAGSQYRLGSLPGSGDPHTVFCRTHHALAPRRERENCYLLIWHLSLAPILNLGRTRSARIVLTLAPSPDPDRTTGSTASFAISLCRKTYDPGRSPISRISRPCADDT